MALSHVMVLTATLFALLCLPCIVAAILCVDEVLERVERRWHGRRARRALRRLDRHLDNDRSAPLPSDEPLRYEPPSTSSVTRRPGVADDGLTADLADTGAPDLAGTPPQPRPPADDRRRAARVPTIEQIAADLRRLHRQRSAGPTTESTAWLLAVRRAYDDRLCLACSRLGVAQHLDGLDGLDREIERVRVEGELEAAGLVLRTATDRQTP